MRTFHTGGVAGADITHGLPRVVELFEARKPKGVAKIAERLGQGRGRGRREEPQDHRSSTPRARSTSYRFPRRTRLYVEHGQKVDAGQQLNEGSLYPAELLEIRGRDETERYLVKEVQEVYKSQGVDINDKHIELIVAPDAEARPGRPQGRHGLPAGLAGRPARAQAPQRASSRRTGGETAAGEQVILGITKASLATDSFLSAASFQETTKVLTDAALEGKVDRLLGLKENVIIGKLIPAATGLKHYRTLEIEPTEPVSVRPRTRSGLLDEEQLAAELGLEAEGLEGLGADISATSATTSAPTSTSPRAAAPAASPRPTARTKPARSLTAHGGALTGASASRPPSPGAARRARRACPRA